MSNILNSFVEVAPYINELISKDIAISICDLEKCLLYVNGKETNHGLGTGELHIKDSVSYESILIGKKVVKRVGDELFGFPYLAISIPLEEDGKIIGSVGFFESIDKQDLVIALADNLNDTTRQLKEITELILVNSRSIHDSLETLKGDEINKINDDILELSKKQISLCNYINGLVNELSDRTKRLKESSENLSEVDIKG